MDLTGLSVVKFDQEVDPDTGVLTLTVRNEAEATLGTILLDQYKVRPFFEALAEIMGGYYPDSDHNVLGRRAMVDMTAKTARLTFG